MKYRLNIWEAFSVLQTIRPSNMKQQELPGIALFTYHDDGILELKMFAGVTITSDNALELIRVATDLTGDERHANLVDISEIKLIDTKARSIFAEKRKTNLPAIAVVFKSKFQMLYINFYLNFSRPKIPTKAFDNAATAREWLLAQI